MKQSAFTQWVFEGGQVNIPLQLLRKMQGLNLTPENLGYFVLALARSQQSLTQEELARDKWIKWSLQEGWAEWQGKGERRTISFAPLWRRLYETWESSNGDNPVTEAAQKGDFNYSKILKWLDQERGTLSITIREKQVIQEFNLKYGWTSDFILIFLQLVFERGMYHVHNYQIIAKRIYESGIDTVNGLISFMNDLDWIQYKVTELKKCIGQYGGVTKPQREMYLKWHRQWKFSHELIMRAAEETVRTNNPNFKYIDAVLEDWHKKEVKNFTDVEKVVNDHDRKENVTQKINNKVSTNKKRISRADQRDWENM